MRGKPGPGKLDQLLLTKVTVHKNNISDAAIINALMIMSRGGKTSIMKSKHVNISSAIDGA